MERLTVAKGQVYRLWITTYSNWRPTRWNQSPPTARAIEPASEALFLADEAALFLEGFNGAMLECDRPLWAVAVPITVRFDGDAQPGMAVHGHIFPLERPQADESAARDSATSTGAASALLEVKPQPLAGDHFHGLGQSPQRSR